MPLNFKPVQNTSLPEAIAEQIMAMITDGHLKPGDRLPTEPELMEQFGVGRSTLREALKSLVMAGLIETRRSAGTFVSESYSGFLSDRLKWTVVFSSQELQHIVEVRYALEGQTAALAAERATVEQKEQLAHLYMALIEAQDPETAAECDTAFHVLIAEASHNPVLISLILSIRTLIRDYIEASYAKWGSYDEIDRDENVVQHQPIVKAVQASQPQEARQAMLDHLDASHRWMLAVAKERQAGKSF
jgi:GntR family transcriptional regulator, transcriptional repressor for pyruvate dehydrogenase complex